MRALEVALLLANLPPLAWCLAGRASPLWFRCLPVVACLLMTAHLIFEGYRWQMWPGYLVTAWLFASNIWPHAPQPGFPTAVLGMCCLLGAAGMATLLPVFEFPSPTGPFRIGTVTRHLVDRGREEANAGRAGAPRELMVQFWYPAERPGPPKAHYSRSETTFKKGHFALVKAHAVEGVPLAGASRRYPVLIFCPSWTGRRNQNVVQAEELTSHGFVVVGIDHPYGTELTAFPDGRRVWTTLGDWLDTSSDEAWEAGLRDAEAQLRVRTADARFVLDEVERLDRDDPAGLLTGRIDTSRVGIFGHSFGGAVAAEACRTDPRFRAGIDLDGMLFGESSRDGVEKPFLFMCDDTRPPSSQALASSSGPMRRYLVTLDRAFRSIQHSLAKHGGYWITIRGSRHMNFCDSPLYSPIKHLTRAGPVVVERAMKIVNEYTLAFFDETLNARKNGLLDGPSLGHPDVHFEAWKPQTPRPEAGILGRETREIEARFSGGPPDLTAADAPGSHR